VVEKFVNLLYSVGVVVSWEGTHAFLQHIIKHHHGVNMAFLFFHLELAY
jgi:hypothetical protein